MINQIIAIIVAMITGLLAGLFLTALASANEDPTDLDFADDEEDIYREWLAYKSTGLNPEEIISLRVEVRELRKNKGDRLPEWLGSSVTDDRCMTCKLPRPKVGYTGGIYANGEMLQEEFWLLCENSELCQKVMKEQKAKEAEGQGE